MYDSGEEYYTELLVFLTRPDGLKENISPTAPYGPEELIRLTPSVIPPQSSSPAGTELDYDDDNDGYLDHIELECGSNPLDALSKPVDYDGDLTPDCVDSDNDNEVADQDKEACFVVECKFDQHFTFWGKPVSETKTNSGDDPSLIFLILTLLSIVTVLKIYAKSQSMCWKWEDANSHNRVNANRMEKEFKDFDFGGKNFNISNFYAWWAMLVVLLLGVFVFRELTIIWMVGGAGVASHLYLKIPEHLAAKKWVQLKSTSGGNALPPQPVAPPLSKPTQGRVTNPMPPQPVAPPLSKPTQDGLTLLVKSILNQRPRRWMPIQTQPYSPIVSKPWDAHKAPETELYEPTTPKSTQQKPPKNIDQNDFKLFYDTKLSKLYRSESQKLIKKEPLNKIGKLTLSNEVKILRKLSKAGLGYQVVEGSNQGSKNPLLIMPDLGSQSLLDVVEHLNSSERKNIIHDFTNAIQEIHAQDVVHRDLKLANIMIKEENGEKKFSSLIDFGTAMRSGTAQTEHLLGGTRPYMHPSQHDQNVKSHEGQDWYAFARILVVLTGACHPGGLESYLMDGIETKVDHELRRIGYRDYEVQSIQEFVNLATKPSADDAKSLNLLANEGLKISKIV